jgi:hypothetical protein
MPTVSIHYGGIVDDGGKECGGCVNEVLESGYYAGQVVLFDRDDDFSLRVCILHISEGLNNFA